MNKKEIEKIANGLLTIGEIDNPTHYEDGAECADAVMAVHRLMTIRAKKALKKVVTETMRECLEIVRTFAEDHKTVQPSFTRIVKAIEDSIEEVRK